MPLREKYVLRAIALAGRGMSVDITGERGSGRSHVLRVVRDHFTALRRNVLEVTGIPSLKNEPMTALAFAGVRETAPAHAIEALVEWAAGGSCLIVVDDWDHLDDSSQAVLLMARERTGVPIVATRLDTSVPRWGATALSVARVDLPPFTMAELASALRARCGADVDAATLAEIFGTSGGNIGIATAIITDAEQEGRLAIRGGQAIVDGPLWSDRLSATAEIVLAGVDANERSALEFIARFGPVPLSTATRVVPAASLQALERAGLVHLVVLDGLSHVSAARPALIAHFRHEEVSAGFLLFVAEALAMLPDLPEHAMPSSASALTPGPRLIPHVRMAIAWGGWLSERSRQSAAALVRCLVQVGELDTAESVLREAAALPPGPVPAGWERVHVELDRARGRCGDAVARLRRQAAEGAARGDVLRARALALECLTRGAADEADEAAVNGEGAEIERARAFQAYARGEIDEAGELVRQLLYEMPGDDGVHLVAGLVEVAQGRTADAIRIAARRLGDARREASVDRMHDFAYLAALAAAVGGDDEQLRRVVEELRASPHPSMWAQTARGAVAALALPVWPAEALALRPDVSPPDGGVPGAAATWWRAAMLQHDGRPQEAAAELEGHGDLMWARGARTTAAYAYLQAAEIEPSPARLHRLDARVALVGGEGIRARRILASITASGDFERAAQTLRAIEDLGQPGRACRGWRSLAQAARLRGEERTATHAEQEARRIDDAAVRRGRTTGDGMTARERQIVRMAVSGMTHAEIATALVLSVRTVESHLHRAMRKADAELRDVVTTYLRRTSEQAGRAETAVRR